MDIRQKTSTASRGKCGSRWSALMSLVVIVLGSGCGTVRVKYIVEPQQDEAGLMKFRLAGSSITLAVKEPPARPDQPAKPDQPGQPPKTGYKLQAQEPLPPPLPSGKTLKNLSASEIAGLSQTLDKPEYLKTVDALVTATGGSEVLALVIHDPFWQTTTLSYSYQDLGSLLLKTVGTEVTDNSKAIIDAVASVAALAVAFGVLAFEGGGPPAPELLTLPVTVDVPIPVADTGWQKLPQHKQWWYRIELRSDRGEQKIAKKYGGGQDGYDSGLEDTMDSAEFFKRYSNDGYSSTNAFPVAVCRQIALHVRYSKDKQPGEKELGTVQFLRTVADPSRIRTIGIPSKGAISLGPVCGGWVDSRPSTEPGWGALEEAAKQIKVIKDAIDKKAADEWAAKHPGQKPPPGKGAGG